jgi:hypothetical protein
MKSKNTLKHNLIVWSIIASLFAGLTLMAVNVGHFREKLYNQHQPERSTDSQLPKAN